MLDTFVATFVGSHSGNEAFRLAQGVASVMHPTEKQKVPIADLKCIRALPNRFILTGTYSQRW